jgi:hypothetical protein
LKNTVTDHKLSYLERKLQGYFNAKKIEFIQALKQRGTFIECCETRGFIYELNITVYQEVLKLTIGLKNGEISIHKIIRQDNRIQAS